MRILFLTMSVMKTLTSRGIYEDLLREFVKNGHEVYIMSPVERRQGEKTNLIKEPGAQILRVKTGNLQKTNLIEKGISTLMITGQFKRAIKKYFKDIKFDLILYTTPPITLDKAVAYVKKRDGAKTYLLLKDIFPQNAIDIGVLSTGGLKGFIYRHFRKQESNLYKISDRIGCMSRANADYLLKNNPWIAVDKVEICPNSVEPLIYTLSDADRKAMREKYGLPQDKKIFVYGGNLGRPQDIPFIIKCIKACKDIAGAYFFIVGDGTEYGKLEKFAEEEKPSNLKLMKRLPKEDFDSMLATCDVGLIFLDYRFTIPNYPSRLLSYMQAGLPVIACTDPNTDVGKDIAEGGFGWQCESSDAEKFAQTVNFALTDTEGKGDRAIEYLKEHFVVSDGYKIIMKAIENK